MLPWFRSLNQNSHPKGTLIVNTPYYNRNVTRYFRMVGEQGDYCDLEGSSEFSNWLEYFAEGILDELKRVQKMLPQKQLRLEPHHRLVLDHIEARGSITQQEYGGCQAGLWRRAKTISPGWWNSA